MIPLFDPSRQNEPFSERYHQVLSELLVSGQYILGSSIGELETQLSTELGYQYAECCSSGTEALVLSLKALKLPAGSEVITPAFSFVASASTIAWAGFKPVFADVDPHTCCVTLESVKAALTPNTKAVICVDLYGRQGPIKELRALCDERGLFLIEDGAQSIGVPNQGAHLFTTSFYPTKNIGALGDGGAILTDSPELAAGVRQLVRQGEIVRDHYEVIGTNGRMDSIQAAFVALKIPQLRQWEKRRKEVASTYDEAFKAFDSKIELPLFDEQPNQWSLYTIKTPTDQRSTLRELLSKQGVSTGTYYSRPINTQPSMRQFSPNACPNAEKLSTQVLAIPIFPELSTGEIEKIVHSVRESLAAL